MAFSIFYKIRCFLSNQVFSCFFRDMKHFISLLFSFIRSLFYFTFGRVVLPASFEFFLIGKRVKFLFEKNAKIEIINTRDRILHYALLPRPFPTGSKIGSKSYWRFINIQQYGYTQIKLKKNATLALYSNTTICPGAYIFVAEEKTLEIKTNSYISSNLSLMTNCGLTIGENVLIAHNVTILDYDGHPVFSIENPEIRINTAKKISIEDNVWIGMNATILKGVTLGKGSIVAANSVVTTDVPSNTIAAGNPARIIKEKVSWKNF